MSEHPDQTTDLKPCPFCGSPAQLHHDTQSDYRRHWAYVVLCTNLDDCSAEGAYDATPEEAITWWNRRVS